MDLKRVVTYKIPFSSKCILWCGIFLSISVFTRYLHYFIPCDFYGWNAANWIFEIILPTLLCACFAVLIKLVRFRSPGLYGILSAGLCLMLLFCDFLSGNALLIILSLLTMPLLGFLLLATFGGYIPFRSISACALVLVCLIRCFFWGISAVALGIIISDISLLLGLFCCVVSLKNSQN